MTSRYFVVASNEVASIRKIILIINVLVFLTDESTKENEPNHFTKAFNKENLSDCGISEDTLQHFCSPDPSVIKVIDGVKYNIEDGTYTW